MEINIRKKHLLGFGVLSLLLTVVLVYAVVPNPGHGWSEIEDLPDPSTICTSGNELCAGGGGGSITINGCSWKTVTYTLGQTIESNCNSGQIVQGVKALLGSEGISWGVTAIKCCDISIS